MAKGKGKFPYRCTIVCRNGLVLYTPTPSAINYRIITLIGLVYYSLVAFLRTEIRCGLKSRSFICLIKLILYIF